MQRKNFVRLFEMYTLLLALIYLAFVSLGLPDSLLGTAWPTMQGDLGAPMYFAGVISMIISAGTIVSSLLSERLTRKLGTPAVTVVSVFLTAAALFGFSVCKSVVPMCIIAVPYGLGAGAIDAALNNYVAVHYSSRHMSWLHCFWGVGTIISPYIMSLALTYSNWNNGYRMTALVQVLIALVLLATLGVWRVNRAKGGSADTDEGGELLGIRGALRIRGVVPLLLGFLGYCAAEATAMLWAASYLNLDRGLAEEDAAAFTSVLFIGITVGRFINGLVADRLGDKLLIRVGTAVSVVGIAIMLIPVENSLPAIIGLSLIGLGFAPIYPCVIHLTPYNFGKENSQAIIGIQMAAAYTGTTLAPAAFGLIADYVSIKLMPIFVLAFVVLMAIMLEVCNTVVSKRAINTK